jgi:hypothetical protein
MHGNASQQAKKKPLALQRLYEIGMARKTSGRPVKAPPDCKNRAARFGLPFFPAQPHAEIEAHYLEECARLGKTGEIIVQREMQLWFLADDPDQAWATLGPCFLKESQQYSSWRRTGVERSFSNTSQSVEELRATRVYDILTPDQALARIKAATADYMPIVQPLTGGLPLDWAWRCMELFGEVMGRV